MTFLLMRRKCDHPYYAFPWEDWANRNGGIINDYTDNEWIQAITWLYSTSAFFTKFKAAVDKEYYKKTDKPLWD